MNADVRPIRHKTIRRCDRSMGATGGKMPYLFLHVQSGNGISKDSEGQDFASLDEAKQRALLEARDIMNATVLKGYDLYHGSILICDCNGQTVIVVPFRDAIGH